MGCVKGHPEGECQGGLERSRAREKTINAEGRGFPERKAPVDMQVIVSKPYYPISPHIFPQPHSHSPPLRAPPGSLKRVRRLPSHSTLTAPLSTTTGTRGAKDAAWRESERQRAGERYNARIIRKVIQGKRAQRSMRMKGSPLLLARDRGLPVWHRPRGQPPAASACFLR